MNRSNGAGIQSRRVWALVLFLGLLLSSCTDDPHAVGHEQSPLIDADEARLGQFSGVLALRENNRFLCTATLIGPRVAVAAMHCVCEGSTRRSPNNLLLVSGLDARGSSVVARGSEVLVPAGATCGPPWDDKDIAVLVLDREVDAERHVVELQGNTLELGDLTLHVGYGSQIGGVEPDEVPTDQSGQKRWRASFVSELRPGELVAGDTVPLGCYGDSGGPIFDRDRNIVGVASRVAGLCEGQTTYSRLSFHADLVREGIRAGMVTLPDAGVSPGPGPTPTDPNGPLVGGCSTAADVPGLGMGGIFLLLAWRRRRES